MKKAITISLLLFFGYLLPGVSFAQNHEHSWAQKVKNGPMNNLYKVSDILYRSGQPDHKEFVYLHKKMGINSSLCLRTEHSDKKIIGSANVKPYLIRMNVHHITDEQIIKSLKIIKNAPHPIVIHCHHRADRTGVVSAMYRIVFQGWSKKEALNELLHGGFGFHTKYKNIPEYIKHVNVQKIKKGVLELDNKSIIQ
jgi:protein tyrosine/serine phosphatase